jgi:hypothetical protein
MCLVLRWKDLILTELSLIELSLVRSELNFFFTREFFFSPQNILIKRRKYKGRGGTKNLTLNKK